MALTVVPGAFPNGYFVGLTVRETASAPGLSVSTVEQEWRYIRAWLQREVGES